jgi:hypothetical protein
MARKNVYCHKWNVAVLEQIACGCGLATNAQTTTDWELFLEAVYEAIHVLNEPQRVVLLLSQEVGLSFVDIARITGKPVSTIIGLLKVAIHKVTFVIKAKSLTHNGHFNCRALQILYDTRVGAEERAHEPADFELLDKYEPTISKTSTLLVDDGWEEDDGIDPG